MIGGFLMSIYKKLLPTVLSVTMMASLCGCTQTSNSGNGDVTGGAVTENASNQEIEDGSEEGDGTLNQGAVSAVLTNYTQESEALTIDNSAWNYDAENDVYWQINVGYCSNPETTDYETMGVYVPGAYMTGVDNGDGTFTCTVNAAGEVAGYTAETAPIVFPVNTAGYSAQAAPTAYSYNSISEYLEAGFVYVYAGMRGRSNGYDTDGTLIYSGGAPWGVTDLKAAVRYYRYNSSMLPGDTDSIFTFGHSGGGAQSAIMGATGDSELYYEYLVSIGAAMYDESGAYISDAISGAMCWCPITSLDYANEAYEWNMGQYSDSGTRSDDSWTSALSDDLAEVFAEYINELKLTDETGNVLVLEETEDGVYTKGSYYDYILSVIETSLNNFLSDTQFPYTASSGFTMGDGGFGGSGDDSKGGVNVPAGGMEGSTGESGTEETTPTGEMPSGETPSGEQPSGETPSGELPSGGMPSGTGQNGGIGSRSESSDTEAVTYETVQDYIDSLNSDEEWVIYDAETNTATITSIEAFVNHCKSASKSVAAFDDLERSQAENILFGNDESDALHFDSTIAELLAANVDEYSEYSDFVSTYLEEYQKDLTALDKFGSTIAERQNMYNPMYFLSDYYEGYGTSTVASHWRIHTGITQGDTALTVEANLALALESNENVEDVEFETVWNQGHTTAERTGDSSTNFIEWVNECVQE